MKSLCINNIILLNMQKKNIYDDFIDKKKVKIKNFFNMGKHILKTGDPIFVTYRSKGKFLSFQGYCIAINNKKLMSKNSSLILRSIVCKIGVQITILFFSTGSFRYKRADFKKIQSLKGVKFFKLSKLYYYGYKFSNSK